MISTREKWGFLFFGYKKDYYFWEIIIAYRKVLIIFIAVYLTTFGVIAQALILLLLLIFFTFLTIKFKPYEKFAFQELETASLVITMVTVYLGLYCISNNLTDS